MAFSFKPEIDLSIIIVNYNVQELLKRCLESIFEYERDSRFEVIVVDNNSTDGSEEMLRKNFPQVRLIENPRNLGFSRGCNQGIRESRGKYVMLLNPDTELTPGGLKSMIDFMDSRPEIGVCGPRMTDPAGNRQFSCRSFPSYLTAISSHQSLLNRLFPHNPLSRRYLLKGQDWSQEREVDWVSGSSLLTRREVLDRIGLLDEKFFMYVEDVDFCYRARKAGFLVYYFPQVEIIHHIGKSTKKRILEMKVEHHRSMYYFFRKHHRPNLFLKGIIFLGIWIRLCFGAAASFFRHMW